MTLSTLGFQAGMLLALGAGGCPKHQSSTVLVEQRNPPSSPHYGFCPPGTDLIGSENPDLGDRPSWACVDNEQQRIASDFTDEGGRIEVYGTISSGLLSVREWYSNGQPRVFKSYFENRESGLFLFWHQNGQVRLERHMVGGKMQGPMRAWYESGRIRCEAVFHSGQAVGCWRVWSAEGEVIAESPACEEGGQPNDGGTLLLLQQCGIR